MQLPREPRKWIKISEIRRGQQEWRGGAANTRQSSGLQRDGIQLGVGERLGPLFL